MCCLDPKVIRDQLLNILMAGRDTTACLLTYVTYVMAMYPDIMQKMRQEVLHVCGHDAPNFEKLKALRYGTLPVLLCFHAPNSRLFPAAIPSPRHGACPRCRNAHRLLDLLRLLQHPRQPQSS